ncbi:UNVERIFIED_CONTAM: hypothetical protein FKN15_000783 [Acipenser sinensis]
MGRKKKTLHDYAAEFHDLAVKRHVVEQHDSGERTRVEILYCKSCEVPVRVRRDRILEHLASARHYRNRRPIKQQWDRKPLLVSAPSDLHLPVKLGSSSLTSQPPLLTGTPGCSVSSCSSSLPPPSLPLLSSSKSSTSSAALSEATPSTSDNQPQNFSSGRVRSPPLPGWASNPWLERTTNSVGVRAGAGGGAGLGVGVGLALFGVSTGSRALCHSLVVENGCQLLYIVEDQRWELEGVFSQEHLTHTRVLRSLHTDIVLRDQCVSGVVVCSPPDEASVIILDALRAGKGVFCEKLPSLNRHIAESCFDEASRCGKPLVCGFFKSAPSDLHLPVKLGSSSLTSQPPLLTGTPGCSVSSCSSSLPPPSLPLLSSSKNSISSAALSEATPSTSDNQPQNFSSGRVRSPPLPGWASNPWLERTTNSVGVRAGAGGGAGLGVGVGLALFGVSTGSRALCHSLVVENGCQLLYIVEDQRWELEGVFSQEHLTHTRVLRSLHTDIVLRDQCVSGVVVCSPPDEASVIILDALRAGKGVFCEKLPSLNRHIAESCFDEASRCGKPLVCGFFKRFDPALQFLYKRVHENETLGRIQRMSTVSRMYPPPSVASIKSSGGIFYNTAVHDIDVICWLLGERAPDTIFSLGHAFCRGGGAGLGVGVGLALFGVSTGSRALCHSLVVENGCQLLYIVEDQRWELEGVFSQEHLTHTRVLRSLHTDIVLRDQCVSGVVVCSPPDEASVIILDALRAGKGVLCEKLPSLNRHIAESCFDEASRCGKPLVCGFFKRFDPALQFLYKRVHENETLGRIQRMSTVSRMYPPPSVAAIKSSGGIFYNTAVHDIDVICWLLGERAPDTIFSLGHAFCREMAAVKEPDSISVSMKFPSGAIASLDTSQHCNKSCDQRLEVHGTEGSLQMDNRNPLGISDHSTSADLCLQDTAERYRDAYRELLRHFLRTLRGRESPFFTREQYLWTIQVAAAAEQSWRNGSAVDLRNEALDTTIIKTEVHGTEGSLQMDNRNPLGISDHSTSADLCLQDTAERYRDAYRELLRHFLRTLRGRESPFFTKEQYLWTIQVAAAAEQSWRNGSAVDLRNEALDTTIIKTEVQ